MKNKYSRLKHACYSTNVSMAIVSSLSPLLFVTFRSLYGISYSLLGLLVLINFCTQLSIDLIFSFFSHKFNIAKAVRLTPVLTAVGLFVYAVYPFFFPESAYVGLVIGTIIFAASGGLAEVLISPVVAAIPSENPDREMSKLHSIFAWGVVLVVILSTAFLYVFGGKAWPWLALIWMVVPILAAILFAGSELPPMQTQQKASGSGGLLRDGRLLVCMLCIFLGSACENVMSQWSSSYLEKAFGISKMLGDIFGVALFAVMLGLGRSLYAKFGKSIYRVLFCGSAASFVSYFVATFTGNPVAGLAACALTGFCVSMLWPGSLIVVAERFPAAGVVVYALMASGGDLGGSVGPQLVGLITDFVMEAGWSADIALKLGLTTEQLGMKSGMLLASLFPVAATILFAIVWRQKAPANPGKISYK